MNEIPTTNFSPIPFDVMNLQVGNRLQLLVLRDQKPVQYFTTLIGYVKDEYLLVKIPVENGALMSFHEGEKLTIRVFTGIKVCAFETLVERVFMHPYFYAHLSFPKVVRATSLRMAMRVRVDLPAKVALHGGDAGGQVLHARVGNVSVSGALLEAEREIGRAGDMIDLSFVLMVQPGNHEVPVSTQARIRNAGVRQPPAPGMHDVHACGVQFVGLDAAAEIALQNLTYEAQVGDRHRLV